MCKNPLNFCCREVGVDNQARFLPHVRLQALIFELCAIIRSAAALPNDRVISWLSGGFIPEDRRLALVGDANCSDLPGIHLPRRRAPSPPIEAGCRESPLDRAPPTRHWGRAAQIPAAPSQGCARPCRIRSPASLWCPDPAPLHTYPN